MSEIFGILSTIFCFLRGRARNKEVFERTFFKLFENLKKLLEEITTWRQNIDKDTMITTNNTNDIEKARIKDEYSPKLNEFFNLLFQILNYIDKNKIKDNMYIDIIRHLLSQEILDLLENYINKNNSCEYKKYRKLVEKYLKS